jgi:HTH-type transcriptional regulator/antitoxin HigA
VVGEDAGMMTKDMEMRVDNTISVQPPGFYIREELEERGWTQRDLAYILGCPEQAVNMIVSGKRGISPEMAKALGDAFDVPAEFFANLQNAYDLAKARDPDPGVKRRARLQDRYPVREMIKRGWLQDTDATLLEVQMAKFLEVDDPEQIPHIEHAAKRSATEVTPAPQLAWLFRVKQIAKSISLTVTFSEKKLQEAVGRLRQLTVDPEEIRHVPRVMMECGVRYIIVEGLPSGKIDGVCFWLDPHSPVIGMSLRLDRIDNFWFVLRHEIEHVLRGHGKRDAIIDIDIYQSDPANEEEHIANQAALVFTIPEGEVRSFIARKQPFLSERDILGFARRVQVHPGIVVGQVQKQTGRFDLLRRHLVKVRQFATSAAMVDGWGQVAPVSL